MSKQSAWALRKRMTDAERLLWRHLRNRELDGWKFRRQYPVGSFIVDFICVEKNLVIEVDGGVLDEILAVLSKHRPEFPLTPTLSPIGGEGEVITGSVK